MASWFHAMDLGVDEYFRQLLLLITSISPIYCREYYAMEELALDTYMIRSAGFTN